MKYIYIYIFSYLKVKLFLARGLYKNRWWPSYDPQAVLCPPLR